MRDLQQPGRSVVMGTRGMVATSQPAATQTGLEVLQRGGNAMDAAVAAAAVLCVCEPASTGIGGDCFVLYHDARTDKLFGLNGSGRAPRKATPEELRGRGHETMPESGILSVTVPGAVHAWETALDRFGTQGLADALAPAIRYAEEGCAVTPVVGRAWRLGEALLASTPDSRRTLLVDGRAPTPGSIHRQTALARSLRLIAEQGAQVFYRGEIAERIVAFSETQGGLFELDDFARHESEWVTPISTDYRGYELFEIPPNGQGVTALMMLNILENTNLGELECAGVDHIHVFTEAFKLALAERDQFVCDAAFNDLPVDAMLDKSFARDQWSRIAPHRAHADPPRSVLAAHRDTVYLSVVDQDRNAASFINSVFHSWGSGLVAGDTGVLLQNRGAGFVLEEGHFNCIAPRKRPLHTIIPAMVYKDRRPVLSYGVMGGHYQAMGHSYVLSNWLDFGLDLQEAVDAPRFVPEDGKLLVERGVKPDVRAGLADLGHRVALAERPLGGAQCIYIDHDNGVLQAASDPRKDGCALGY